MTVVDASADAQAARVTATAPGTTVALTCFDKPVTSAFLSTKLRPLTGAFAGIVPKRGGGALLYCDQSAFRPLYYTLFDGVVRASTDFAALRATLPDGRATVDSARFAQSLSLGWVPDEAATIDPAVRRVPAGSIVAITDGDGSARPPETIRYHVPDLRPGAERFEPERLIELLTAALADMCGSRQISGVMLSGGLDSTSVAMLAHRAGLLADDVLSWTRAATPDDPEASLGALVAERCGISHVTLPVDRRAQMAVAVKQLGATAPITAHAPLLTSLPETLHGRSWLGLTGFGGDPAQNVSLGAMRAWRHTQSALYRARSLVTFAREEGRLPPLFLTERRRRRQTPEVPPAALSFLLPEAAEAAREALLETIERTDQARADQPPGVALLASPYWSALTAAHDELPDAGFVHPFMDWRVVEYLGSLDPVPWAVRKRALRESMRGTLPEAVRTRAKSVRNPPARNLEPGEADVRKIYSWLRANEALIDATGVVDVAALRSALSVNSPPRWWWPRLLILVRHAKWFSALAPNGVLR